MRVTIDQTSAKQLQNTLKKAVGDKRVVELLNAIGKSVKQLAHANCDAYGGRSFWRKIKQSIDYSIDPATNSVEVGSTDWRSAHVQNGGPISAPGKGPGSQNREYLTIPISPKSYGKSISSFNRDEIVFIRTKTQCIVFEAKDKGKKGSVMEPLFVLVKKTKAQKPRPFLPWGTEAETMVFVATDEWIKAIATP